VRLLYLDTGYLLALVLRRDRHHEAARTHFQSVRGESVVLVTTDAVLGETFTRLRYDAGVKAVRALRDALDRIEDGGTLRVQESTAELREQALALVEQYDTRPLSYADAVGTVLARQLGVDAVLGFDGDFRMLGLTLEP
jgi:predicted nucleic acid-binding protein